MRDRRRGFALANGLQTELPETKKTATNRRLFSGSTCLLEAHVQPKLQVAALYC